LVFYYLYISLHGVEIMAALEKADKLRVFDTSLSGKFSIFALLSGWLLLNIAAFGLDQDMAQRVLSCKNDADASKSLILSILITIPIVLLFLGIGALLFVHYQTLQISQSFKGESITIFMYYILNEMPSGLRGLVTVGAIAAALSSTNSVLGAMASVAIEDMYRPYKLKKAPQTPELHFVKASRRAVLFFAFILTLMACLCRTARCFLLGHLYKKRECCSCSFCPYERFFYCFSPTTLYLWSEYRICLADSYRNSYFFYNHATRK